MKKQIIMLGIVVLIICVGLSGCEEETTEIEEPIDTDGDGYNDDVDDFPTDSNLHKLIVIRDLWGDAPLPPVDEGEWGGEVNFYVESDCKFVEIKPVFEYYNTSAKQWRQFENATGVTVRYQNPEGAFAFEHIDYVPSPARVEVNYLNYGNWRIWFINDNPEGSQFRISYDIDLYK